MQSLKVDLALFMFQRRWIRRESPRVQSFVFMLVSSKTGADFAAAEEALMSFSPVLDSH